jgi:hypothetical protein
VDGTIVFTALLAPNCIHLSSGLPWPLALSAWELMDGQWRVPCGSPF